MTSEEAKCARCVWVGGCVCGCWLMVSGVAWKWVDMHINVCGFACVLLLLCARASVGCHVSLRGAFVCAHKLYCALRHLKSVCMFESCFIVSAYPWLFILCARRLLHHFNRDERLCEQHY